ncbi:hypothetical protein HMI56_002814 [Coelomomyces lativittatus]|nr:hypothetical protein HMI56_002814 [Coelomomyces lativittatus]
MPSKKKTSRAKGNYISVPTTHPDVSSNTLLTDFPSSPTTSPKSPTFRVRSPRPYTQTSVVELISTSTSPPANPSTSPNLGNEPLPLSSTSNSNSQPFFQNISHFSPSTSPISTHESFPGSPQNFEFGQSHEYFSPDFQVQRKLGLFEKENLEQLYVKAKAYWRRILFFCIIILLCLTVVIQTWRKFLHNGIPSSTDTDKTSKPPVTLDQVLNFTLTPNLETIRWLSNEENGEYSVYDSASQSIFIHSVTDIDRKIVLVKGPNFRDQHDFVYSVSDAYTVSPDRQFVLFSTNRLQGWRYSFTSTYIIYDVKNEIGHALANSASLYYASFAPVGHRLVYVKDNNMYIAIFNHGKWEETPLTFDGASDKIYHGISDWVYEEEVLSSKTASYWSPQGDTIVWFRFDDRSVPEYELNHFYDGSSQRDHQYPQVTNYRYPKPGFPNPSVSLFLFRIQDTFPTPKFPLTPVPFPKTKGNEDITLEPILAGVYWTNDTIFIVPVLNRIQTICSFVMFNKEMTVPSGQVVREELLEKGWIEPKTTIVPVPFNKSPHSYVTLAPVNDFLHLVLYDSPESKTPQVLTHGEWEVTEICGYHSPSFTLYYLTTFQGPSTRTLYKINLDPLYLKNPRKDPTAFHGEPAHPGLPIGFYSCDFSPKATHYVLTYEGPDIPFQHVYATDASKSTSPWVLEVNSALKQKVSEVAFPKTQYTTFPGNDGQPLHAKVVYPPHFDESKRYPVLLRMYNGPNSQAVQQKFDVSFDTYLASSRNIVVVMVDGHGTGYRGNIFRYSVYHRLGVVERDDQIAVLHHLTTLPWVEVTQLGIWGWSYGGYLTCRIVEKAAVPLAYAVAVAPVTDWLFYDSIYTERYMSLPDENMEGYRESAVSNMEGFKKTKFLLVHGTSDDNVHILNSLSLIRKLQMASVHSYQEHFFPESSHSIHFKNAYKELWELMDRFIGHTLFGEE